MKDSHRNLDIRALPTDRRVRPGDDLVGLVLAALDAADEELLNGDILCVASKVVALSEGAFITSEESARTMPGDDMQLVVRDAARARAVDIVAEAPWVTITRTHHGLVAANGGIDRSNVANGAMLDLPYDPDASAGRLREGLAAATGRTVSIIITDTFGRPWRVGPTDVAIGASGLSVLRDERGSHDLDGAPLAVTVAAVGDALAAAADLVRNKASATPFVRIRGLLGLTVAGGAEPGRAADLVRPPEEDLFRRGAAEAALAGIAARRTVRAFEEARPVPLHLLESAVAHATTAPAPHHTRPWRFIRLLTQTRATLLDAMGDAWRADLRSDGLSEERITARIGRSDRLHRTAPELLAAFVDVTGAHHYPDMGRARAERDLFVLSGGSALEALLVALAARGLGSAWTSASAFAQETVREVLRLPSTWESIGLVAVGWPATPVTPRPEPDATGVLEER